MRSGVPRLFYPTSRAEAQSAIFNLSREPQKSLRRVDVRVLRGRPENRHAPVTLDALPVGIARDVRLAAVNHVAHFFTRSTAHVHPFSV